MLDDPAWFGAVMGSGATAIVVSMNPGQVDALSGFAHVTAILLVIGSGTLFCWLLVRDFAFRRLGRGVMDRLRSPRSGPAYATIPGALNVLAIAVIRVWPGAGATAIGWSVLLGVALLGTALGVALTVILFVTAFEHENFRAEDLSGIWFIPETVVLLGSLLIADLAELGPVFVAQGLAVVATAVLGSGGILFAVTAVIFVNRLVMHAGLPKAGAPAMWIMISPLAVTSLALQAVSAGQKNLGGIWTSAVREGATLAAGFLWGFALWWIAAAAVVTAHVGRSALTRSAADWGFVFPTAAMVIATLTLARTWRSGWVEVVGFVLAVTLGVVWLGVTAATLATIRSGRARAAPHGDHGDVD